MEGVGRTGKASPPALQRLPARTSGGVFRAVVRDAAGTAGGSADLPLALIWRRIRSSNASVIFERMLTETQCIPIPPSQSSPGRSGPKLNDALAATAPLVDDPIWSSEALVLSSI